MKGKRSIEVIVSPQGDITIDAVGFKGADCTKLTQFLLKTLGVVKNTQKKPEYHQRGQTSQTQTLG